MFVDFDAVFHPSEDWKNEIVSEQSPCVKCKWKKEMENPYSFGEECTGCKEIALWHVKCLKKLWWLEHREEKKTICPINGAPCCECVPGAYCAVEVKKK